MRLRTGTCITPPAWISRFGSILHYASFLKQPLYFPNTFFTLRIYLMRRFRFNYTMYEVLVFLSIYRTCAGALVLILSTLSATATTLRRPTFSFRPISPYRSVLARINNHRFFDVNAMRGSRPMGSSPTLSCTESISHDDIDRICATQCNMWLFGDALLVSS